jgi:hypothetical protein
MNRTKFLDDCLAHWTKAIGEAAGPNPADSMTWHGLDRIRVALQPFMGSGRNHAHYPTGGGMDLQGVEAGAESGCLSFSVDDRVGEIMKPNALTLEYFAEAPRESFLLLELANLTPSGANQHSNPDREEVLEYPLGRYMSRDLWERGYLRHDEDEREVPLPHDSRLVTRWFRGKVLIVAKGCLWNGEPATYDGRHNAMTASEIRAVIERSLPRVRVTSEI